MIYKKIENNFIFTYCSEISTYKDNGLLLRFCTLTSTCYSSYLFSKRFLCLNKFRLFGNLFLFCNVCCFWRYNVFICPTDCFYTSREITKKNQFSIRSVLTLTLNEFLGIEWESKGLKTTKKLMQM